MITLAPISVADPNAVETLLDAAFGADRHARTAYRLRAGAQALPELSFAAFEEKRTLVGTLQSWPVELAAGDGARAAVPLTMVGPVAVHPDRQRDGIGRMLMDHALAAADAQGEDALMLIGDPEYYGRFFGFGALHTAGWTVPGPVERHRLLARLAPGKLLPRLGTIRPRCETVAIAR